MFTAAQAAQKVKRYRKGYEPRFTAAQAAQKTGMIGYQVQFAFTAAQAAQKKWTSPRTAPLSSLPHRQLRNVTINNDVCYPRSLPHRQLRKHAEAFSCRPRKFTAAQAAQKRPCSSLARVKSFTAAQAAQK